MLKTPENTFMVHTYNVERFEKFVGKTMNLIETLGLQPRQEDAFKNIIKQEIWSLWENPWGIEEKRSLIDSVDLIPEETV